ncbi:MAG: helix-turn-helix domain-containing protein [Acidimicrobiales bacterium]
MRRVPILLSAQEAAALIGVHHSRIRKFIAEGRLKAHLVGATWVIEEQEAKRFAALPRKPGRPFNSRKTGRWAQARREAARRSRAG